MDLYELRQSPHLSASAVGDYVECGLLYKFSKIDKIPWELKPDVMEFGTVIHLVLGEFYQERMIGNRMLLKDIHKSFEEHWRRVAENSTEIKYSKGKDFKSLLMVGIDLLTVWHNKLPDDEFQVIGLEEPFSFKIPSIPIPIIGAIDLIEEDDAGTIIITDFKTSSRAYSISEVDQNQQLTTYQMAMKNNGYEDREILLRFDCLIKTQKSKFEQYYTIRTEIDEIRLARKIQKVWDGISKGVFIPNDTSWKCKGCAFKSHCDDWFERRAA